MSDDKLILIMFLLALPGILAALVVVGGERPRQDQANTPPWLKGYQPRPGVDIKKPKNVQTVNSLRHRSIEFPQKQAEHKEPPIKKD